MRLRDEERGVSSRFIGIWSPRDGAGQAGRPRVSRASCLAPRTLLRQSVGHPRGCGRHHSLMNTCTVKLQSSTVKTESLPRNLHRLPVCCSHVLAVCVHTHMQQGSAFTLSVGQPAQTPNCHFPIAASFKGFSTFCWFQLPFLPPPKIYHAQSPV